MHACKKIPFFIDYLSILLLGGWMFSCSSHAEKEKCLYLRYFREEIRCGNKNKHLFTFYSPKAKNYFICFLNDFQLQEMT